MLVNCYLLVEKLFIQARISYYIHLKWCILFLVNRINEINVNSSKFFLKVAMLLRKVRNVCISNYHWCVLNGLCWENKKGRYLLLVIANSTNKSNIHSLQMAIDSFFFFGKTLHGHYMVFNIAFNIYYTKLLLRAHEPLSRRLSTILDFLLCQSFFPFM